MEIGEYIDRILRIIVWGVIGFIILLLILKWLGVVSSPEYILETVVGILIADLIRLEVKMSKLESKLNLIWSDFRKRKKL